MVTPTSHWMRWTVLSPMDWLWIRGSVIIDISHVVCKAAEKHLPVLVGWLTTPVIMDPISLLRYSLPCFNAGASPATKAWFCKVRLRGLLYIFEWSFMLLCCRKSSLQIDVIKFEGFVLYMKNKTLYKGSTWLTNERAERDKDTPEHGSPVTGKRNRKLSIKTCTYWNKNRLLFQCQVHNDVYNKLDLTINPIHPNKCTKLKLSSCMHCIIVSESEM